MVSTGSVKHQLECSSQLQWHEPAHHWSARHWSTRHWSTHHWPSHPFVQVNEISSSDCRRGLGLCKFDPNFKRG